MLVAVERRRIATLDAVEHGGDGFQSLDIGGLVAGDLQLEPAAAIGRRHFLERLGQPVVDPVALGDVARDDRVGETDGMPDVDHRGRFGAVEEAGHVLVVKLRRDRIGPQADEVAAHRLVETDAKPPAQRVKHRAVDERLPVACNQGIEFESRAGGDMGVILAREKVKRRRGAGAKIRVRGKLQRLAELMVVLCVRQREVLVEPFRAQRLGGKSLGLAPFREADAGTNDCLPPVRRGRDAEAERHAQAIRPLVAVDRKDLDAYSAHASAWSGRAGASLSRPVRRS